jgi:hypothetical protein
MPGIDVRTSARGSASRISSDLGGDLFALLENGFQAVG